MKNYRIRREQPSDFAHIHTLIKTAFATADDSDHQEQFLVERLRQDPAFLPKLALVAEHKNGEIIGHIVFSGFDQRYKGVGTCAVIRAPHLPKAGRWCGIDSARPQIHPSVGLSCCGRAWVF